MFPTATKPDADQPAAGLRVPGLILNAPGAELTIQSNATELAAAWRTATVRTVAKAEPGGLAEGFRLSKLVGMPGADRRTQKTVRALLTGYLLFQLTGDKAYKDFADADVVLPKTVAADPDAEIPALEDKVAALLKG